MLTVSLLFVATAVFFIRRATAAVFVLLVALARTDKQRVGRAVRHPEVMLVLTDCRNYNKHNLPLTNIAVMQDAHLIIIFTVTINGDLNGEVRKSQILAV